MTEEDKEKRTPDAPRHSDEKGVNPSGAGPAQPREQGEDEPGAESAGDTARASEDTYD